MEMTRRNFVTGTVAAALAGNVLGAQVALADQDPLYIPAEGIGTRYLKYPNPDEIGTVHETQNVEDFDIVVVGTGVCGMCCGMVAAEQAPDAKILLIDKMPVAGGNTNFAEINEGGLGMSWEEALAKAMEKVYGQYELTDPFLFAHYYADNGKVSAWYFTKRGVEQSPDHFYYKGHTGASAIQHLVEQCNTLPEFANVEIRLDCQGIALLKEDEHTVTGIQVKNVDTGEYTNINAKAVMIATGGMGTNTELLEYYTGEDVIEKSFPYGFGQDGDGHLMVEYTAHGRAKAVDPTPMWALVKGMSLESPLNCCLAMQNAGVFVNQYGTRFHNENYAGSFVHVDHSFMQQGKVWSIVGQGLIDRFQEIGSDARAFYYYNVPTDLSAELAEIDKYPSVVKADSFAELAEKIGVPVDAFVAEMELYDEEAKAGTGDSKFGKDPAYMVPFGEPPYYACELISLLMQTNNGIRINTDCQVVDPYYVPIKGLYAGGIAVSGFNTSMYTMGTAQHVGLWSGCIGGLSIVKNELGIEPAEDWFGPEEFTGPLPDFANMEATKPLPELDLLRIS